MSTRPSSIPPRYSRFLTVQPPSEIGEFTIDVPGGFVTKRCAEDLLAFVKSLADPSEVTALHLVFEVGSKFNQDIAFDYIQDIASFCPDIRSFSFIGRENWFSSKYQCDAFLQDVFAFPRQLTHLCLKNMRVENWDAIVISLNSVTSLQHLDLSNTGYKSLKSKPWLIQQRNLHTLILQENSISSYEVSELDSILLNLTTLVELDLSGNELGNDNGHEYYNPSLLEQYFFSYADSIIDSVATRIEIWTGTDLSKSRWRMDGLEIILPGLLNQKGLRKLGLRNCRLGKRASYALRELLFKNQELTHLSLSQNYLNIPLVREGLLHQRCLASLDVSQEKEWCETVCDVFQRCSSFKKFELQSGQSSQALSESEERVTYLNRLLPGFSHQTNLKEISFSGTLLTLPEVEVLNQILLVVPSLTTLDIQRQHLGDEGFLLLVPGLKSLVNLQSLGLGSNDLTDSSMPALNEVLLSLLLKRLDLSNNKKISGEGLAALRSGLERQSCLEVLEMHGMAFGDGGARVLGQVLMFLDLKVLTLNGSWRTVVRSDISFKNLLPGLRQQQNLRWLTINPPPIDCHLWALVLDLRKLELLGTTAWPTYKAYFQIAIGRHPFLRVEELDDSYWDEGGDIVLQDPDPQQLLDL